MTTTATAAAAAATPLLRVFTLASRLFSSVRPSRPSTISKRHDEQVNGWGGRLRTESATQPKNDGRREERRGEEGEKTKEEELRGNGSGAKTPPSSLPSFRPAFVYSLATAEAAAATAISATAAVGRRETDRR